MRQDWKAVDSATQAVEDTVEGKSGYKDRKSRALQSVGNGECLVNALASNQEVLGMSYVRRHAKGFCCSRSLLDLYDLCTH